MILFGKNYSVERLNQSTFEIRFGKDQPIKVKASPANDGTFFCERKFMALTFKVDSNGNLCLLKK